VVHDAYLQALTSTNLICPQVHVNCSFLNYLYGTERTVIVCCRQVSGRTKSAEAGKKIQHVNIIYSDRLEQIAALGTHPEINITQVMAIDTASSYAMFVILLNYLFI